MANLVLFSSSGAALLMAGGNILKKQDEIKLV